MRILNSECDEIHSQIQSQSHSRGFANCMRLLDCAGARPTRADRARDGGPEATMGARSPATLRSLHYPVTTARCCTYRFGAGGSRSRIPYVHRSCRRLSPTSQKLKPTTPSIETLLRREVCEPRFWAAIYSWSEGAKSAHFDSGKLSSAKFGTCVVGETRLIQRADRAQETKTTHAQKRARPR